MKPNMQYFATHSTASAKDMPVSSPTISLRLPDATKLRLDRASKLTRRSRSFLMQEALERHLKDIVDEQTQTKRDGLKRIMALAGAGASVSTFKSAKEVDEHVRWLRGND
jgi:predicted transcriptional regulator